MAETTFKYPMLQKLQDAGADIKNAVARMMDNEDLVNKFLLGFPDPARLDSIKAAVAARDYKLLEETVHKIKGTAGNLGLTKLHAIASLFVNHIRQKHPQFFDEDFENLANEYTKMSGIIEQYL
ncbi:MAG: Hpt domain-containing protein [Ruminococcus sp.]|nr:Hpt domain-containing protein [Ruminococcus sp.]